jgi:hypothetical protein
MAIVSIRRIGSRKWWPRLTEAEPGSPLYRESADSLPPGRTRGRSTPVYWRAYEPEGPIRRVYSAHNLGLRRADAPRFLFEDTPLRAGLERAFSERILQADRVIWHNRRVTVQHEGSQSLPELWTQALGRGRCRALLWEEHPSPLERRWGTPGWLGTLLYVLAVTLRDSGKQFRDLPGRGLRGAGLLKLPGYVLLTMAFHMASGVGMFSALSESKRRAIHRNSTSQAPEGTANRDATAATTLTGTETLHD